MVFPKLFERARALVESAAKRQADKQLKSFFENYEKATQWGNRAGFGPRLLEIVNRVTRGGAE